MASTTEKASKDMMSDASMKWDQAEKGYLTDAERIAKNMDVDGKGHLSREQSVSLGSQFHSLKEDNKQIKKQLYGLAILCVLLFIGTIAGTVMAVKNSKDTVVDMKTGLMKVKNGADGVDIVTVKAQGTTFQTTGGSVVMNEGTTTNLVVGHCISSEDVASMWLANEQGTDARLVILGEGQDTETSSIEPVTTGRASWNQDYIVMGGMTFIPNEECTNHNHRRKLLESHDIDNNDRPSFDSNSIHRALKHRVDFLSGRRLDERRLHNSDSYSVYGDGHHKELKPLTIELGTAKNYAILSKTGVTNVPSSAITGNIGVSPIVASAITGFVLAMNADGAFSTNSQIVGNIYASDYAGDTASDLSTAVLNMEAAYTDAAGRLTTGDAYLNLEAGVLDVKVKVLGPGVYTFDNSVTISSDLTFSGTATDVFIIQIAGSFIQAGMTNIILEGGALAKNIFWQVAGAVSIGGGAHLEGILLAKTGVTFITGSSLNGRVLAQTAVALQMATITEPVTETITDPVTEPVIEPVIEPVTESVTEP
jgi:hypothetical protein